MRMRSIVVAAVLATGLASAAQAGQGSGGYKVGERVVADFGTGWLESVVVAVDLSKPYPYRVHPLGYLSTMDSSFSEIMLRDEGWGPTKPIGGIKDDPWLLRLQGRTAFHPTGLYPGNYECYSYSGGRLQAAMALNFQILDGSHYRDAGGRMGTYAFNAGAGQLVFQGGALNGQRATYKQASNPPTRNQPPNVTFQRSGDSCDRNL